MRNGFTVSGACGLLVLAAGLAPVAHAQAPTTPAPTTTAPTTTAPTTTAPTTTAPTTTAPTTTAPTTTAPTTIAPATAPAPANATPRTTPPAAIAPMPDAGYGWMLLQMVLVLVAVCLLAYALLRFGMRRFQATAAARARGMRVVARLALEPRRSIYVVEIGGRHFVFGAAEGGLTQLSELDAETVARLQQALAEPATRASFKDILAGKKR